MAAMFFRVNPTYGVLPCSIIYKYIYIHVYLYAIEQFEFVFRDELEIVFKAITTCFQNIDVQ